MADYQLLLEAERRGIPLPQDQASLLQQAKIRGLIPPSAGKHGAVTAPKEEPTPLMAAAKDSLNGLGLGVRNATEGLAQGADIIYKPAAFVTNTIIRGLNNIPGTSIPYAPTSLQDQASVASDNAGLPSAKGAVEDIISAGQKGAASMLPTLGLGAIMKAAPYASTAARAAGDFLTLAPGTQIAAAAGGTAAGETAKQAGAGPGGQLAAEVAGGLGLGGGYAVAKEGTTAAWRAVNNLLQTITSQSGAEKRAGEALMRLSSHPDTLEGRLSDAVAARGQAPQMGANPTTAQLSADPGLLAAQNALRSTDPRAAGQFANRDAANNAAWQNTLRSMAPEGFSADHVAQAVRSQFNDFQNATDDMIRRATERAQAHIASLGANITPEQAGAIIRNAVTSAYTGARQATRGAYQAVDPTNATQIPLGNIYSRIAPIVERTYGMTTDGTPPDILRRLTRLRDTADLPISGVEALRREFGDIAGDINRSATDRSVARQISDNINDYVGEIAGNAPVPGGPGAAPAAASNLTPEQAAQLRLARLLRSQQGETFERGAVGQVTKTKPYGEMAVPNSGVAGEFLFSGSGSPEAARAFVAAVGNRPQAVQALQDYAATSLRQYATNPDGSIYAPRLNRWVADHRGALVQFPELMRRIGTAANAQTVVDSLAGRQTRALQDVQKSSLGYFLGDMNPEAAVAKIMNSSSSATQFGNLVRVVRRDPEALNGLRRSMVDNLLGKSTNAGTDINGENLLSQAKFGANLEKYMPMLRQVFSPNHIAAMQQIQSDLDAQQLSTAAKALGSNTVQNMSASSLISAVSRGALSPENPLVQNVMRPYSWLMKLPDQKIKDILTDAMLDPDLAVRLVRKAGALQSASLSTALKQRAVALSLGTGQSATRASEQRAY